MSKAKFTILRQCENCSKMFEAQKRTTRFCSTKCASQNYKLRQRLKVKNEVETEIIKTSIPKVKAINLELLKHKEFLTIGEAAILFSCSKKTVYRMIKAKEIKAINLSQRLTRVKRNDIEQLFVSPFKDNTQLLTVENCYSMPQIIEKYKVSRNTIYSYVGKHGIERIKTNGITYYSKFDIEKLFS